MLISSHFNYRKKCQDAKKGKLILQPVSSAFLTTKPAAAIHCPPPLPPRHGRLLLPRPTAGPSSSSSPSSPQQQRLLVGETVQYACKEGFILIGEPVIRCTEAALWSHSVPFCKLNGRTRTDGSTRGYLDDRPRFVVLFIIY